MNLYKNGKSVFFAVLGLAVVLAIGYAALSPVANGEVTQLETGPPPAGLQKTTFAAGCFWSMQAIFQQLKGVVSVSPGYAGGTVAHPSYELVETGTTGYAESINITYDPKVISYETLLKILLTVRDPTTMNQQGPDYGTNYRSIIFYRNDQEKQEADGEIHAINAAHIWRDPIVTTVQPFTTFYRAEAYHLNYYNLHPDQPYCAGVIAPEIENFQQKYRSLLKS